MGLLDLLFPPRCAFCRRKSGYTLCSGCQASLPWLMEQMDDGVLAPLRYEGAAREAILRFKFGGFWGGARAFGLLMAQLAVERNVSADVVTWVPCSFRRRHRRGYDQSRELAAAVGRILGKPVRSLLVKTRHTPSQRAAAGAEGRRKNVRGAFAARAPLSGLSVLLIDDVCTTGATLQACRSVLLAAGAARVHCLAAARTMSGRARDSKSVDVRNLILT